MKTETQNLAIDLSGATEPMYVTYEQAIAISGYRDLVSLFTAGMERAKNERIMEGVESDQLRDEPTGAGFFEYYVRHLPNGPADFRQEMIVMYDFIQRIEALAIVSLFIQKIREYPDKDALNPRACFFLRHRILGDEDQDRDGMKKAFKLYQEAGDSFKKEHPDFGLNLLRLLKARIVKFLNEIARQIHYATNIVLDLRGGGTFIRELRNAELSLMDICHQSDLFVAIPNTDAILDTNVESRRPYFAPLFDSAEGTEEFFPVLSTPFITELSTKASLVSCTDLQRTGEEMEKFAENTAKKLWESYCVSVEGTAIDNAILPDWETFRNDPAKKRQSDGWVAMARTLIGDLAKTAVFTTHYGQTETIPFLDCEFEIDGALAIPILLRYRNAALIPHDNPNGRVVIVDIPETQGRTTFMLYDVERERKYIVAVTSDDYKQPFRVVRRDPSWAEFPSEFQGAVICKPGQEPTMESEDTETSNEEVCDDK